MFDRPHLLLDISRLLWRTWRGQLPTGIDRACLAYVEHFQWRALAVLQRGGVTRVLGPETSRGLFLMLLDPPIKGTRLKLISLLARSAMNTSGPRQSLRYSTYLNVGHTGLNRLGHRRWVMKNSVNAIYCVYDLIPITHPQFARAGQSKRHAERMRTVLKYGTGIIGISYDSIEALASLAGANGLSMPPTLRVPLAGTPPLPINDTPRPIDKPYFVTLGTIEGRKNHLLLLRVWRRLIDRLGERTPPLVIIGQRGWCADEVFQQLGDPVLRGHVIEFGRCDDAELQQYLLHAQALLFPSFVEGQGLPLIEALTIGTPVIASNLAVFRETAGSIPDFLDPTDDDAWLDMILRYCIPESPERAAQVARLDGFRAPTWEDHFSKVENWLLDLGLPLA